MASAVAVKYSGRDAGTFRIFLRRWGSIMRGLAGLATIHGF